MWMKRVEQDWNHRCSLLRAAVGVLKIGVLRFDLLPVAWLAFAANAAYASNVHLDDFAGAIYRVRYAP
jgi:hypothetical protein